MEQRIERWKEREETTPLVWAAKMAKCIVSHGLGLPNAELRQSPDCGTWPSSCPLFFFFIIIIALIDYTLDDWGLRMTSLDI
ncbi:hypothetical protein QQP08_023180 [Theobroma cacao]|nr:hypothetical protein QQP08_023180 [Theobroma cacao]